MADTFSGARTKMTDPVNNMALVTPSDAEDLAYDTRCIHITVAGNVKITTVGGQTITAAFAVGTHACRIRRIWNTGKTATIGWVGW